MRMKDLKLLIVDDFLLLKKVEYDIREIVDRLIHEFNRPTEPDDFFSEFADPFGIALYLPLMDR